MRGRSSFAAAIQSALAATAEVSSATANATSGSLLVSFDPAYDPDVITGIVGAQLETLGDPHDWPAAQAKSVLAQVVDEAVPGWKDRVGPVLWTAGAHSLDILQGGLAISIVNVASGVVPPVLPRLGITQPNSQLKAVGAASAAVAGAGMFAQHHRSRAWRRLSRTTEDRLRVAVFQRLEVQDLAFFDEHGTGPLLNLLTDQVSAIGGLVGAADELIEIVLTIAVSASALLRASPGVALISGLAFPAAYFPAQHLGRKAGMDFSRRAGANARFTQVLETILTGIVEVKSFTARTKRR